MTEASPPRGMELGMMAPSFTDSNAAVTMTVYERVFGIVELMDEILAQLPPKNIFGLQRVSKQFYRHINGTTIAARKAHLTPMAGQPTFTTLLRNTKLRSLMLSKLPFTYEMDLDEVNRHIMIQMRGKFDKLGAPYSWSEMLLTQPPVKQVWIKGGSGDDRKHRLPWFKDEIEDGGTRMLLTRQHGIRLCDVIDVVRIMRRRFKVRSPCISFFARFGDNGYLWNSEANGLRVKDGLTMVSVLSDGLDVREVTHEGWE